MPLVPPKKVKAPNSEVTPPETRPTGIVHAWIHAKRVHSKIAFLQLKYRKKRQWGFTIEQVVFTDPLQVSSLTVGSCLKGNFYKKPGNPDLFFHIQEAFPGVPPYETSRIERNTVLRPTVHGTKPFSVGTPSQLKGPVALSFLKAYLPPLLIQRGLLMITTPSFSGAGAQGGAQVFRVDYFGQPAVLAQSKQLYKQMVLVTGLGPVFQISPTFRAQRFDTNRHLSQFTTLDVEIPCGNLDQLVCHALDTIKDCFRLLKQPIPEVRTLTFDQARQQVGGDPARDLSGDQVLTLSQGLVIVTHFPAALRPFYTKRLQRTSESFDIFFRGIQLVSGSLRECRKQCLCAQIAEAGISVDSLTHYVKYFDYGMPASGGYGVGLERVVWTILGLADIRDVVWIIRDRHRLSP